MTGRRGYCDRMEAALRDWGALFEALEAEAAGDTTHVRASSADYAATFHPRRADAERALAALRAPGGNWPRAAADLERAVGELRRALAAMERGFAASLAGGTWRFT
jgi:putative intracellular protease/amidase